MENIKTIRDAAGLTRNQFSALLGIPYRTVQDWELGNRHCPEYLLELIKFRLEHKEAPGA